MKFVYQVVIKEFFTQNGVDYQCADAGMSTPCYSSHKKAYEEYKRLNETYKSWYPATWEENLFPNEHIIMSDGKGGRCQISLYKVKIY